MQILSRVPLLLHNNRSVRGGRAAVLRAAAGVRAGPGAVLPDAGGGHDGQTDQGRVPPGWQTNLLEKQFWLEIPYTNKKF